MPANDAWFSPECILVHATFGHFFSRSIYVAAQLRVADLLADGSRSFAELAAATDSHPEALERVLRLLVSVGVFAEDGPDRLALNDAAALLRSDHPMSMHAWVLLYCSPGVHDRWAELSYSVETGKPGHHRSAPGNDVFSEMARDMSKAAVFDAAMATFAPLMSAAVAAAYEFDDVEIVADVGGGNGSMVRGILAAHPHLRGIIMDQPHVAPRAAAAIAADGLESRCTFVGGSFFEPLALAADRIIIKHVLNDWPDDRAVEILVRARAALRTGGRILVVESVYPEHMRAGPMEMGIAATDVNMLVSTGGRTRSRAAWEALVARAELHLARLIPTSSPSSILELVG